MKLPSKTVAEQIVDSLTYEAKKQPGAILLNGGWGVGKTHLWRKEISKLLNDRPRVYVSLFGVKSADELKSRLTSALVGEMGVEKSDWTEEVIKSLPSALLKGLEGLAKKHLGDESTEILKSLHLKLDPLKLFPSNTIVCLDDLERSKMDVEEVLVVVNYLLEHKSARVLIIANEDYLNEGKKPDEDKQKTYKKFKEKVVWQTISFHVPLDQVFDSFVNEFATNKKDKINELKPLILDTLNGGDCKNLRTLQKIVRILDHILSFENIRLEEKNIRFLIALIDEDATNGLHPEFSVYAKNYSPVLAKAKGKPVGGAIADDERIGRAFYSKYFEDEFNIGFSLALYEYVRTGILNEMMLFDEIAPADEKLDAGEKLCREFFSYSWRYQKDDEIRKILRRFDKYIRDDGKTKPFVLIRLFGAAVKIAEFIDEKPSDDLEALVKTRVQEACAANKSEPRMEVGFQFIDEEEGKLISPLLEFYGGERPKADEKNAQKEAIAAVKAGKLPDVFAMSVRHIPWVIAVLTDSELLDLVDGFFETRPDLHELFYQGAIKKALEAEDKTRPLNLFKGRIANIAKETKEKGASKRLALLLKGIETNLPKPEPLAVNIEKPQE